MLKYFLRLSFSRIVIAMLCVAAIASCNSDYTSRKRAYYKIEFPERKYVMFDDAKFPFSFEYPAYGKIIRDTSYFDKANNNPYWFNIDFSSFNGKIYFSYKKIGGTSLYKVKNGDHYVDSMGLNVFDRLVTDAYKLTFKNDVKAYSIEDSVMHTANGVSGVFFRVEGNVATARQFFLSDTTKHFLRGALYFNATPNEDSLRPVHDFLQKDLMHIINTFRWRDSVEKK
jgi:gliding motility-associated lipoprotein GldD